MSDYGKAPSRLDHCLCCGAAATPGPFEVHESWFDGDRLLVIGYILNNEFIHVAWQLAEMPGEYNYSEAWQDSSQCAAAWNKQN